MSAVRKPDVIPIRVVEPAPDEPRFTPIDEMFCPPMWGKHDHSEADLRTFWSRIWRAFKSRRLCEGFLQMNRLHSLDTWANSFERVRQMKDGKFEIITYVHKIACSFETEGTPGEKAHADMKAVEEKLAQKAKRDAQKQEASPVVLKYWSDKAKTPSIHDIPEDDPDLLAVVRKLKGDRTK